MNKHSKSVQLVGTIAALVAFMIEGAACSSESELSAADAERDLASEVAPGSAACPADYVAEEHCGLEDPDECTLWCEPAQPPTECPPKMEYGWRSFTDDGPMVLMCFPRPSAAYCPVGTNLHALCEDLASYGADPACWVCR